MSACSTGRVTIDAAGGMAVVKQVSAIIHRIFTLADYFSTRPSATVILRLVVLIGAVDLRRKKRGASGPRVQKASSQE